MAYDPAKPAATTSLKLSNPEILANFAALVSTSSPTHKRLVVTTADADNVDSITTTQNDVTNNKIGNKIVNAGTGNGVFIDQNGNGRALNIDSEATTQPAIVIDMPVVDESNSVTVAHGGTAKFQIQHCADATENVAIILGTYYIWVDVTGDLRIKSGAPTSDTDGTVVGAQS